MSPYSVVHPTRYRHHDYHKRQENLSPDLTSSPTPTSPRPNLGPLTTTFTPPTYCTRPNLACSTCKSAWRAQSCAQDSSGPRPEDDTGCWPRATSYPNEPPLVGLGFYSPGVVCPTGYTSACTAAFEASDQSMTIPTPAPFDGRFQFPLVAGETAVGCCPTGYTCASYTENGRQTCHAVATSTRFDAMLCTGTSTSTLNGFFIPFTTDAVTVSSMDLWAPLIQINWQASDLPGFKSTSSSSRSTQARSILTASTASSVPITAALQPANTDTAQSDPALSPPKALSSGAIAGISISCALALLAAALLLFYLYRRRSQARNPNANTNANPNFPSSPTHKSSPSKIHTFSAFTIPLTTTKTTAPDLHSSTHPSEPQFATGPVYELGPGGREKIAVAEGNKIRLDTQSAGFGRGLGVEDDLESPIDGSSPFRLKRGNTVKKKGVGGEGAEDELGDDGDLRERRDEGGGESDAGGTWYRQSEIEGNAKAGAWFRESGAEGDTRASAWLRESSVYEYREDDGWDYSASVKGVAL
ncbi:hypothetical protein CC78DRAFT_325977 [Lojkania enalia]|uniref:Uncharacterized protein n=1 Tax=Lojkania enalia TaxID=147567 RepID=A0A9P4K5S3_9PLEO|nr:hypothetical protein CC78DRAFT_325977 [Didymosphaeria enalia]